MSMKNSNDTVGNRTHDLPTCSAAPQPTALPRAPTFSYLDTLIVPYDTAIRLKKILHIITIHFRPNPNNTHHLARNTTRIPTSKDYIFGKPPIIIFIFILIAAFQQLLISMYP